MKTSWRKNIKKKKNYGCPKKYGNKNISAITWMNIAITYGDLFYTPKSLPGCFCSEILLTAKNKKFCSELKIRLFSRNLQLKIRQ